MSLPINAAVIAGVTLGFCAMGASANTITVQGINFSLTDLGGGELEVMISPATGTSIEDSAIAAGGGWSTIESLAAIALKPNGGSYSGASISGWNFNPGG